MPVYKWVLKPCNPGVEKQLVRDCGLHPLAARILVNRGISSSEEAHFFLHGTIADLHCPSLMCDLENCVAEIQRTIRLGQRILVYGDYDVDGMTATAVMVKAIRHLGGEALFYLPRRSEGYGLHTQALRRASREGVSLVVTVDCGITAVEEIVAARDLGLTVLITDHHEPQGHLPDTIVVNPKRQDCPYPYKELAGVGVALKVAMQLLGDRFADLADELYGLACIGTIADVVPLISENRIIVRAGLPVIWKNIGLAALAGASCSSSGITIRDVAYGLVPRLNAAGRLERPELGVELLLAEDPLQAQVFARELTDLNTARRELEARVSAEVLATISEWTAKPPIAVFTGDGWPPGVTGIVASRLVDRLGLPVILIGVEQEEARGSARSPNGFDIFALLSGVSSYLEEFGGHRNAAGFSLPASGVDAFVTALQEQAASCTHREPVLEIDAELGLSEVNEGLCDLLEGLEPWGVGNPEPVFLCRGVRVLGLRPVGKDGKHLKLSVGQGHSRRNAIAFGMGEDGPKFGECAHADLAFRPTLNEWNGRRNVELKVVDWRGSFETRACGHCQQPASPGCQWLELPAPESEYWVVPAGCTLQGPTSVFDLRDQNNVDEIVGRLLRQCCPVLAIGTRADRVQSAIEKFGGRLIRPTMDDQERKRLLERWVTGDIPILGGRVIDFPPGLTARDIAVLDLPLTWSDWSYLAAAGQRLHLLYSAEDQRQNREMLQTIAPNRAVLAGLYRILRRLQDEDRRLTAEGLAQLAYRLVKRPVATWTVRIALTILAELGTLQWAEDEEAILSIKLCAVPPKQGLGFSSSFRRAHLAKKNSIQCQRYFAEQPGTVLRNVFGCDIIRGG